MEKISKDKRVILFVSLMTLLALVLLGSALKDVSFLPVQRLSQTDSETIQVSVGELFDRIVEVPFWKQAVFWVLLFFFVLLISSLLSPEMRKRVLLGFLRIMLFTVLFIYIIENNPGFLQGLFTQGIPGADSAIASLVEDIPPPIFEPPQISGWLSFFIALVIILLSVFLIWRVNRWWTRQNELLALRRPLDEIAQIARTSLQELSLGNASPHDAIIQCYERMSRVVESKRGLNREFAMTPAEFAARLERAGLPREPVNQLTHLFEAARYGAQTTEQHDVDEAIACLTSILKYCGETA